MTDVIKFWPLHTQTHTDTQWRSAVWFAVAFVAGSRTAVRREGAASSSSSGCSDLSQTERLRVTASKIIQRGDIHSNKVERASKSDGMNHLTTLRRCDDLSVFGRGFLRVQSWALLPLRGV